MCGTKGTKEVVCPDCGTARQIRKDSTAVRCMRCRCSLGGIASRAARPPRQMKPCAQCGKEMPAHLRWECCSRECSRRLRNIDRVCKTCGTTFRAPRSLLAGKTNASGNFCSRPCYEAWLCPTPKAPTYRPGWKEIAKQVLREEPFCALCGTPRHLEVHHIVPFRLVGRHERANLIALCHRHHKVVETLLHDVEAAGSIPDDMGLVVGNILRAQQQATAAALRDLRRRLACAGGGVNHGNV